MRWRPPGAPRLAATEGDGAKIPSSPESVCPVIWFYVLGQERRVCETRLAAEEDGFELIIGDSSGSHVEHFRDLPELLRREHEVLAAWRAQGWQPTTAQDAGLARRR